MTRDDISRVLTEVERRWRERTPATRVDEVNASYRVGRGEIRQWCGLNGVTLDEMSDELEAELLRLFVRLRREFPDQQWDHYNAASRECARRNGIRLPRHKKRGTQ